MYRAVDDLFGVSLELGSVPFHGRTDRSIIKDILLHAGLDYVEDRDFPRVCAKYLEILPEELDNGETQVFVGVEEMLKTLVGDEKAQVGLLTGNMEKGAELKLEHSGLSDHFDFGAFGDHHHHRNDVAKHAYGIVNSRANEKVDPSDVWILGDTPADIECGRAIGANVLAVATGGSSYEELAEHKPDILVKDLAKVSDLLHQMM